MNNQNIKKWIKPIIFILVGAGLGFLYYFNIGCVGT